MARAPAAPASLRPGRRKRLQTNSCSSSSSSSSSSRRSGTSSRGRACACSWLHWRALAVACAVQLFAVVDHVAASGDHLKAGDAAVSSGQYSAAVRHYSEFIKTDPSAAVGYTKRAAVFLQQRKFRDAERDLDAAVQAEPTSVQPLLNRGRLLRQLCRFDSALKDFNTILEIKPGQTTTTKEVATTTAAKAALARVRTLLEQGKVEEANRELDAHVLTAAPDCVEARVAKAQAMLTRSDYDGVVAETSKILKVNENDMQGLLLRAKAYMYLGDHDVAMKHHQAALRYDPDHDEHKKEYRKLKNLEKKTKEANEQLEKKKYRSAVEQFKAAMEMMPEHKKHAVKLQMGLCKAYVKLTRGKEAADACTIVLDAEPDNYDARMQRGEARLLLEEWEAAMQDFKHAMQINQSQEAMMGHQRAEKGLKMSKRKDFYKILEVEKTATAAEIKRSYKKLALKWHPDKNTENKDEAEAKFRDIAAAYEVLGDEEKRGRYDRGEDVDQPEGQGGAGFNPFGQQFHFQAGGGFPGGGFPGGFQFGGGFPGGFHFGGFGG